MTEDTPVPALTEDAEKPTRRRSMPAAKPKDMPAPKKKRPTAEDVAGVGGMEKTKWSGVDMWRCPKCHATTFKEADSKVHKCKQARFADEEGLAD
jgi:hypothetical protein